MHDDYTTKFLIVYHLSIDTPAILLNALLLFSIVKYAPSSTRNYSILMGAHTLCEMSSAIISLGTMQRIISAEWSLSNMPYGVCNLVSTTFCFIWQGLGLCALLSSITLNSISIWYRHRIIFHEVRTKHLIAITIFSFIFPFPMMIFFILGRSDDAIIFEMVKKAHPDYDLEGTVLCGVADVREPPAIFSFIWAIGAACPLYFMMYLNRLLLLRHLAVAGHHSVKTTKMHQRYMQVLTYQAFLPLVTFLGMVLYVLSFLGLVHSPILESLVLALPDIQHVLMPMLIITLLPVYRRSFKRLFIRETSTENLAVSKIVHSAIN